ncbi:MAG: M48 family metallopeptidase [Pseudomonadales bacterium]
MNFFQAQDDARKKTVRLALLFGAAVLSLILLTNLLVAMVYVSTRGYVQVQPQSLTGLLATLPTETWIFISLGVIGVVGVASLYKYLMIQGGGRTIAESLGGQLLTYDGTSGNTRRLLNVVEEMAIASGVPVPPVYLIPESSINALAAGFGPDDAVIGVNQGTVDLLSRDELQGVIAHEFSHILNGDTTINLRLIAILHGILFLGMVGYGILRGVRFGGRRSNGGGALPVLLLGVGLLVIGYSGTFFGNLIKAAVSRQREYLADAAAVQFTRNPPGIGGALKKIGGYSEGSTIRRPAATEASHMFFGQVRRLFLNPLTATHPPLEKRIRAIDPGWDGTYPVVTPVPLAEETQDTPDLAAPGLARGLATAAAAAGMVLEAGPEQVAERVGTLDQAGLASAQTLIAGIDPALREAAHDPWGARGLVYAMLLDPEPAIRERQFTHLQAAAETGVPAYTARLTTPLAGTDLPRRLALVEMAMPALKALSRPQYDRFIRNLVELVKMDQRISLPEWVLHRLLVQELTPHFEGPRRVRPRYGRIEQVADEIATVLSTLARFGQTGSEARAAAFAAGMETLNLRGSHLRGIDEAADENFNRLNGALRELRKLKPLAKPKVLKACAATVTADGHVSGTEGALLQGIAAALDCPLPPSIYAAP